MACLKLSPVLVYAIRRKYDVASCVCSLHDMNTHRTKETEGSVCGRPFAKNSVKLVKNKGVICFGVYGVYQTRQTMQENQFPASYTKLGYLRALFEGIGNSP